MSDDLLAALLLSAISGWIGWRLGLSCGEVSAIEQEVIRMNKETGDA
jgi:hypothetical protein